MKRFFAAAALAALLLTGHARAQFAEAQPGVAAPPNPVATNVPGVIPAPARPDGPLGALAVAPQPQQAGGIISLGPITGNPFVDQLAQDVVNSLIAVAMGWIFWLLKNKLNVNIDKDQRDALTAAAQRQASSLVADGMVSLSGKTVTVNDKALFQAANALAQAAPDAIAHFGIKDPQKLADRIVDMIPHVPAIAPAIADAHADPESPIPPQQPKESPA
jgi:hypothetical protein